MYYTIKNNLEDKVIGYVSEQASCITIFTAQQISAWKLYGNVVPTQKFELKKRAKLTDTLWSLSVHNGFLINEKVKNIIENHNIMRHQYFDTKVYDKNDKEYQYYWLHLSEPDLTKTIDFPKSLFCRKELLTRKEDIKLNSYEEYENICKQLDIISSVDVDKIALSDRFDKSLDMFYFLPLDNKIYISEKLKTALENANVAGFEIKVADNFLE
jgi:hypothetical protein